MQKKIVDKGYERARKILTEKIDDLHKIAKALLVYETLSGDEIRDLILKNIKPTRSFKEEEQERWKYFVSSRIVRTKSQNQQFNIT